MTERKVVFPENMDTAKGLPYDSNTKKYYVDPSPLVNGTYVTTTGSAPNKKITLNPKGMANFAGKGLRFNNNTNKFDVNHDDTLQINGSNQLGLHPDVLNSLEDKLSDLYNKLKSEDKLLEKVEYKPNTKELWFYVGSPQKDGDETILKVNIADLVPVTTTRGLKGNGTAANPLDIRLDPSSSGAEVTANGLKITAPEISVRDNGDSITITTPNSSVTIPKNTKEYTGVNPIKVNSNKQISLDYNTSQFEVSNGKFQIKSGVIPTDTNTKVKSLVLNGSILELTDTDNQKKTVDLSKFASSGGSADGNTKIQSVNYSLGVLTITDTDGNSKTTNIPTLCTQANDLTKGEQEDGDYVIAISKDGTCKLIPAPTGSTESDERNSPFYCWVPYAVVPTTNAATQEQEASVSYKFKNNYDNQIEFTFEMTQANALSYTTKSITKTSGSGSASMLSGNNRGVKVVLPARSTIQFLVRFVPHQGGNYTFLMTGQTAQVYGKDLAGGNSFSACGRSWDNLDDSSQGGGMASITVLAR